MDTNSKKSMVSAEQLNSLLEFMKEHPDLAKGLKRGRRGKLMTVKIWAACAKKLNTLKPGAVKDGKGWSKYWCDWKYRVRRRALELKAARDSDHTPETPMHMSDIEETIINIIGENSLENVVIKASPIEDDSNDEMADQNEYDTSAKRKYATRSKRKHSFSIKDESDNDNHSEELCSSPKMRTLHNGDDDLDSEDEASQFLRLERQKIESMNKMVEAIQNATKQLERLTDAICDIKDRVLDKLL